MRYKQLILRKISELKNFVHSQDSNISMLRPPEELKFQLQKILSKIHEIEVLLNTEDETNFNNY